MSPLYLHFLVVRLSEPVSWIFMFFQLEKVEKVEKLENPLILVNFVMFQDEYGMEWWILKVKSAGHFVYLKMKKNVVLSTFPTFSTFSTFSVTQRQSV